MSVQAYKIGSFVGQEVFGVTIEESEALAGLMQQAETLATLPFAEKLEAVEKLAIGAMQNAWEKQLAGDTVARSVVFTKHSLGQALEKKLGCCRYQATLFLILGAKAKLGTKHYLQSAPITPQFGTCFNDVFDEAGKVHHVSIFAKSLSNPDCSYAKGRNIYEKAEERAQGMPFLAYTVDAEGECSLYSRVGTHFDKV